MHRYQQSGLVSFAVALLLTACSSAGSAPDASLGSAPEVTVGATNGSTTTLVVVPEDGAALEGYTAWGASLASMPAPAAIVSVRLGSLTTEVGDIVAVDLDSADVLYWDETRPEIAAPPAGSLRTWAFAASTWGPGVDIDGIRSQIDGRPLVAILGYYDDLPNTVDPERSHYAVMALLTLDGSSLEFVGPSGDLLTKDLATVADAIGESDVQALVELAREMRARDTALAKGDTWTPAALLSTLAADAQPSWASIPPDLRDVLDAPEDEMSKMATRHCSRNLRQGSGRAWVSAWVYQRCWLDRCYVARRGRAVDIRSHAGSGIGYPRCHSA